MAFEGDLCTSFKLKLLLYRKCLVSGYAQKSSWERAPQHARLIVQCGIFTFQEGQIRMRVAAVRGVSGKAQVNSWQRPSSHKRISGKKWLVRQKTQRKITAANAFSKKILLVEAVFILLKKCPLTVWKSRALCSVTTILDQKNRKK
jgi:hypothetical protein